MSLPFPVPDTSNIKPRPVDLAFPDRIRKSRRISALSAESMSKGSGIRINGVKR